MVGRPPQLFSRTTNESKKKDNEGGGFRPRVNRVTFKRITPGKRTDPEKDPSVLSSRKRRPNKHEGRERRKSQRTFASDEAKEKATSRGVIQREAPL